MTYCVGMLLDDGLLLAADTRTNAGVGNIAVFKQLHPTWSPMAIKSALMTTAGDVLDGPNTFAAVIFRQGAGHVAPSRAANPGLVFDSGFSDWLSFLCGVQPGGGCAGVTPIDPSNFNSASIAIGDLGRFDRIALLQLVAAAAGLLVSVASLAGVLRSEPEIDRSIT